MTLGVKPRTLLLALTRAGAERSGTGDAPQPRSDAPKGDARSRERQRLRLQELTRAVGRGLLERPPSGPAIPAGVERHLAPHFLQTGECHVPRVVRAHHRERKPSLAKLLPDAVERAGVLVDAPLAGIGRLERRPGLAAGASIR